MNRYLLKAHQERDSPGAIAPTQAAASPERHLSVPAQVVLPRGPLSSDLRCPDPNCASHHVHSHPHLVAQTRNLETNYVSHLPCLLTPSNPGRWRCPLQRSWSHWLSSPSAWGNSFSESQWEAVGRLPRTTSCPDQGTKSLPFLGLSLHICITGTNPCRVNLLCYLG